MVQAHLRGSLFAGMNQSLLDRSAFASYSKVSSPRVRCCAHSSSVVRRILAGAPKQVSPRPEALFEVLGERKSIVITACDRPIFSPSIAIPPAVPAPADYADTIWRFSRSGRLQSPTGPDVPDLASASETSTVPGRSTEAINKHKTRKKYSRRHRNLKPDEGAATARIRRGAVVPGTAAHRHPNDPDPVEPFEITIEDGGVVAMELVAHQGKSKRAFRTAVLGPRAKQAAEWMEEGARGACQPEIQGGLGAGGEEVMEGGRGEGWGSTSAAVATGRRGELPGPGRGVSYSRRNKKRSNSDGEGVLSQGNDCPGHEIWQNNDDNGDGPGVSVTVSEEEALDGVHGAPVFLGGQLFGFAIQVH